MKKYKFLFLFIILFFFYSSSCRKEIDRYFITIKNNSDKEIVFRWATVHYISQTPSCLKPPTRREYNDFIYDKLIKPNSSKKLGIDSAIEEMQNYLNVYKAISIGIFYRSDMDAMSCDDFRRIYPLKKEWNVTLADLETANFDLVLVYTSETQEENQE